jgi:hypothetical protein
MEQENEKLKNHWKHGSANFRLPSLPNGFLTLGVKALRATLDPDVGQEIILLIIEEPSRARAYKLVHQFQFSVSSGTGDTSLGPLIWTLTTFTDSTSEGLLTHRSLYNPSDPTQVELLMGLQNQEFWHILVTSEEGEVHGTYELPNQFDLATPLGWIQESLSSHGKLSPVDFSKSIVEFDERYQVEQDENGIPAMHEKRLETGS